MKTQLLSLAFIVGAHFAAIAQKDSTRVRYDGILRAGLSFAPGTMTQTGISNIYISADMEYYLSTHFAIVGGVYVFLNTNTPNGQLLMDYSSIVPPYTTYNPVIFNHHLYSGFNYHLLSNRMFDPYIGLQPGLALTRTNYSNYTFGILALGTVHESSTNINPMLSANVGFNVYAVKFFHLFCNVRYTYGRQIGGTQQPLSLSEFMFSFGLGINLNAKQAIENHKKK